MLLLLFSHSALSKEFDTDPQAIETIDISKGYKTVKYSKRYTFTIPGDFKKKRLSSGSKFLVITTSNDKGVFAMDEILGSNKVLFNPSRYGLNSYSRRQLISAIFDNDHDSNNEVNETRKLIFEHSNNVEVYKRAGFLFFRKDRNDDLKTKVELTISTPINDDVLSIGFFIDDEELIMNVIKSLKVNKPVFDSLP